LLSLSVDWAEKIRISSVNIEILYTYIIISAFCKDKNGHCYGLL
jgi:hypothetical protein